MHIQYVIFFVSFETHDLAQGLSFKLNINVSVVVLLGFWLKDGCMHCARAICIAAMNSHDLVNGLRVSMTWRGILVRA